MSFEMTLLVGWGDLDSNGHMANTSYLNKAVDARAKFLADCGYPQTEFLTRGVAPVALRDEIDYFREFRFHDDIRVTLQVAALSADETRGKWRNEFFRGETLAARVTTLVGWMDLRERKLVVPPDDLRDAIRQIPRTDDFTELPART